MAEAKEGGIVFQAARMPGGKDSTDAKGFRGSGGVAEEKKTNNRKVKRYEEQKICSAGFIRRRGGVADI